MSPNILIWRLFRISWRSKDKKAHKDKHSKTANSKSSDAKKGMGDFKSRLVY